ncbi:MAG: DUF6624 domain-containing protein [Bacteroidota bacterium]
MEALETVELQVAYLEQLYEWDQQVRHTVDEQIQTYGFNSPEHLQAAQDMVAVDNLNLAKIEAFFAAYGHPKLAIHGKSACGIPWMIIHHAQRETAPRHRLFPVLYQAYVEGDIEGDDLAFYLNRMHQMYLGYRIQWEGAYRVEQELDTLFKALRLEEMVAEVDARF